MFKQPRATSLLSRVRQHILWLTITLFLLFSLMTVFIVYALEDAIFKEQLQQNYQVLKEGGTLPKAFSLVEPSQQFTLTPSEQLKYLEFEDNFGEFQRNGKHFHFMKTELGVLLFDSSGHSIFSRIIDDILLLLLLIFIPSLALTYWVSSKLSAKALSPFTQVYQAISSDHYQIENVKKVVSNIREQDIQTLATKLVNALEQKANILEEQIIFNQGMAHEIRTPLQVMGHSTELLEATSENIADIPAFKRLNKSIVRMNRISTALLWITSNADEKHCTAVAPVINNILEESQFLLKTHQIKVSVNEHARLKLPFPGVVLELIVFNLLTNVVHHCQTKDEQRYWHIELKPKSLSLSNPVEDNNDPAVSAQRFGLGLMLVGKLADKFSVKFETIQEENEFKVTLTT